MSSWRDFRKSGHWPSLLGSFLYFDFSFMVWMLIGATSIFIASDLNLTASQKGFLVALPILGGSVFRILLGFLADWYGAKKTAVAGMSFTMLPLLLLWVSGTTLTELYVYGFLLGIAGASFAAALPLVSRWYPPQHQGLAMGIAGAGNSGTLLATWFAPRLAEAFNDWHIIFGIAMALLGIILLVFLLITKEAPYPPPSKSFVDYFAVLKIKDAWVFCFFYSITFGGFVGMASFLSIFFHDQYGLNTVSAGDFVTLCVLAGSFFRPIGGWISDKVGGIRVLQTLFFLITVLFVLVSFLLPFPLEMGALFLVMTALGLGNGAVFQLVPQRFGKEIGIITGIVGAAGGLGGFFLPSLLGWMKDATGTFATGYLIIACIAAGGFITMWIIGQRWSRKWDEKGSTLEAVASIPKEKVGVK